MNLRPANAADDAFLLRLYAATREDVSLFGWDAAAAENFVRMQFEMQRRSYAMQYPQADRTVILFDEVRGGRMIVDRSGEVISLVDIALMPEYRRSGAGSYLIRELQREADEIGKCIQLTVDRTNSDALALYQRLGFETVGENEMQIQMRWKGGD